MNEAFRRVAHLVSTWTGSAATFLLALAVVIVWAVSGPFFGFSDTWQLVINTGTTIVTFLMVFLIQNTQNRDSRAIHMKLDELIIYTKGAENGFVELENLSDEQLDKLEAQFHRLARTLHKEDVLAHGPKPDSVKDADPHQRVVSSSSKPGRSGERRAAAQAQRRSARPASSKSRNGAS